MIPTQMLKGVLDGCILAVIGRRETYGYEIAEMLRGYGFGRIAEGTVYPLLLRLEHGGLIEATYRDSAAGPRRKYYRLTAQGQEALRAFWAHYRALSSAAEALWQDTEGKSDEQTH